MRQRYATFHGVRTHRLVVCSECSQEGKAPLRGRLRVTCSAACGRRRDKRLAREKVIAEKVEAVQLLSAAASAASEELLAMLGVRDAA